MRISLTNLVLLYAVALVGCNSARQPEELVRAAVSECAASQAFVNAINSLKLGVTADEVKDALKGYPQTDSVVEPKDSRQTRPTFRVFHVYPSPACVKSSGQQLFVEIWFKDTAHLSGLHSNIKGINPPSLGRTGN